MNLGAKVQSLVPSEGSKTISSGNDFGWYIVSFIFTLKLERKKIPLFFFKFLNFVPLDSIPKKSRVLTNSICYIVFSFGFTSFLDNYAKFLNFVD